MHSVLSAVCYIQLRKEHCIYLLRTTRAFLCLQGPCGVRDTQNQVETHSETSGAPAVKENQGGWDGGIVTRQITKCQILDRHSTDT
jgi:hypothetical protein